MNTAKISTDGTHQIVILPKAFQIKGTEVYIKKVGNAIVLIAKDNPWQFFESLEQFSIDLITRQGIETSRNYLRRHEFFPLLR